jgi:quercetin dioxygenase-like cupin family protein
MTGVPTAEHEHIPAPAPCVAKDACIHGLPQSQEPATNGPNDEVQDIGASVHVLVSGADTKGRLAVIEIRERRGGEPLRHLHHWEDEIVYVLEGEVTFALNDEHLPRSTGSCVVLPAGHEHAYAIASEEARLLVITVPAGLEDLYRELGGLNGAGRSDVERLVTVAARYGVEITGPPGVS